MKHFFTILLSAITGAVVALIFQKATEVQPQPAIVPAPRTSRKLEDLAPSFKILAEKFSGDQELYEDHQKAWIKFVREAVQANLTELEANQIIEAILAYEPPPYNFRETLFPPWEKEEKDEVE